VCDAHFYKEKATSLQALQSTLCWIWSINPESVASIIAW